MEKMKMESINMTERNIDKIAELFPNCITETVDEKGKPKKAINFEILKQMLSDEVIDGDEAYEFTWVGKKASIVEANKPIRKTLRPCKEESVDWDTTENLYIEGDNLEVLKLLQESYLGKVKMIYIDPPYNTGNDFIYNDDFKMTSEEYADETGELDDEGNRMFKNTDGNGRFHSDWCSMIYSRLMLARNLLSDDGVIFISIGQDELDSMIKIVKEVFGEKNYLSTISRVTKKSSNSGDYFAPSVDYIVTTIKNSNVSWGFRIEMNEDLAKGFNLEDKIGKYKLVGFYQASLELSRSRFARYYIDTPDGHKCIPPENKRWRTVKETYDKLFAENRIVFKETSTSPLLDESGNTSKWNIYTKSYQAERASDGYVPREYIEDIQNNLGTIEIRKLNIPFTFAKPTKLVKYLSSFMKDENSIILDFFSGSATTAHAVMQLNAEDGGNRKFIMVQLPEKTDEKSEAFKAGYKNICEIGKERIRRAGNKIKEESPLTTQNLDTGFRVFKLDDSNMKDVYYSVDDINQNNLMNMLSNIKEDRTDLDLLFGCLLEWGLPLSLPYSSENIEGFTVHNYNDGDLVACFEENIPESVIKEIAKKQPLRAVFRDSSFVNSPSKINVSEIFKLIAPDTRVKVI